MRKARIIREQIIKNNKIRRDFSIDSESTFSVLLDRLARSTRPEEVAPIVSKIPKVFRETNKIYDPGATLVGRGSISFSPNAVYTGVGSFEGSGGWLARYVRVIESSASFDATATAVIIGSYAHSRNASFGGVGQWDATANAQYNNTASFEGVGSLSATANTQFYRAASFEGVGGLSATANTQFYRAASFLGEGSVNLSGSSI